MKSEKGQSLVEFALILPLLMLLLFGIVDFGRIFHAYLTIDHAGREAAREASIGKGNEDVIDAATEKAFGIDLTDVTVTPEARPSGTDVTVTITYEVTFLTPLIGGIVGPITLTDNTLMRVE
jgi:Flp pilus assembly protein TadG